MYRENREKSMCINIDLRQKLCQTFADLVGHI